MRKAILIIIMIVLITLVTILGIREFTHYKYDVNRDGNINVLDAVTILNYIKGDTNE